MFNLITLCIIPSRQDLSMNLELHLPSKPRGILLPPSPVALLLQAQEVLPGFLCGWWGFELWPECLHSKCCYTQSHLPNPQWGKI